MIKALWSTFSRSDTYADHAKWPFLPCTSTHIIPNLTFRTLHVPGHTIGSILYILSPPSSPPQVFTGDTIFSHDIGRFFESRPTSLIPSLSPFLASLTPDANLWPGHEYSPNNSEFLMKYFPTAIPETSLSFILAKHEAREANIPLTWREQKEESVFIRAVLGEKMDERLDVVGRDVRDPNGVGKAEVLERISKLRDGFVSSYHL